MLAIMSNIGMPSLKLIRRKLIINYAILEKHKPINGLPNQPESKEK